MSKGYTISFFIGVVGSTTNKELSSSVPFAVSPQLGPFSVKYTALNTWLSGSARDIALGNGLFVNLGKTPKTRLLRALKARKAGKFDTLIASL